MDEFVYIGKIVNTHGIKGEIRILSKFSHKKNVFVNGMNIYIGRNKEKEEIVSYRHHKCFEMITLKGYDNINDVLKYKGALCYVKRSDLNLSVNEYLNDDLIGLDVYNDGKLIGSVVKLEEITDMNSVLWILYNDRQVPIPFNDNFVKVDIVNKKVDISVIEGMI